MRYTAKELESYTICPMKFETEKKLKSEPSLSQFFNEFLLTTEQELIRKFILWYLRTKKDNIFITHNKYIKGWQDIYIEYFKPKVSQPVVDRSKKILASLITLKDHLDSYPLFDYHLINYSFEYYAGHNTTISSNIEALVKLPDDTYQVLIFSFTNNPVSSYKTILASAGVLGELPEANFAHSIRFIYFDIERDTLNDTLLAIDQETINMHKNILDNVVEKMNQNVLYPNPSGYKLCDLGENCCGKVSRK